MGIYLKHRLVAVLLWASVLMGMIGIVWACGGGGWPPQALSNRDWTLRATPYNSLSYELKQIGQLTAEDLPLRSEVVQRPDVSAEQKQQILQMRQAADGDQAYQLGAGLPEDVRLYTAAAVDYHLYTSGNAGYPVWERARKRFEAVLALNPQEAQLRSSWAAFMLGRMHLRQITMPQAQPIGASLQTYQQAQSTKAQQYFQLTRELVRSGANDAEGLAVTSLGEEARAHIWYCSWPEIYNSSFETLPTTGCSESLQAEDFRQAFSLYARQVLAHDQGSSDGDGGGYTSLIFVSGFVYRHPQLFAHLLNDPVARRVLVTDGMRRTIDRRDGSYPQEADAFRDGYLSTLADAMAALPDTGPHEDADRLAALAYRTGRYDLAARFVQISDSPLVAWVGAKLALQKGDLNAAADAYALALQAFAQNDLPTPSIAPGNEALVYAESGVLALARSDYMQAMQLLWMAYQRNAELEADNPDAWYFNQDSDRKFFYYGDATYLAERILTTDELKLFVDTHVPATDGVELTSGACAYRPASGNDCLRWLLARRLMRDARYDEAASYFPASYANMSGEHVDLPAQAQAYAQALSDSGRFWQTDITKAQHLFNAAMLLRLYGKELIGYQGHLGNDNWAGVHKGPPISYMRQTFAASDWEGADELARYNATVSQPEKRWYYRHVAIGLVEQAADKVPARSQAFAAMLCHASGWGDDESKKRLYARYVREGAMVDWGFNPDYCPEPDFDKARRDYWQLTYQALVRRFGAPLVWSVAGAGLLACLLLPVWAGIRYRRKRAEPKAGNNG
ncbi:MAG: hypothetical protein MESAZ_02250 [Saezia sanguinis]